MDLAALAQIPTATNEQITTTVVGVAAVLWFAVQVVTLIRKPAPPPEEKVVTAAQLERELKTVLEKHSVTAREMAELQSYTRQSVHELRNGINALQLAIAANQEKTLQQMVAHESRIIDRLNETDKRLERVLTKIDLMGKPPPPQA